MAKTYGTVTTFTAGSVLTAAQLNVASTAVNNLVVPPSVQVRLTSDVNPYTSATPISWSSSAYDTDGMFSSGTVVTVQTTGVYVVTFTGYANATATLTRVTPNILKNGVSIANQESQGSTTLAYFSFGVITSCTAGDTLAANVGFTGGSAYILKGNASEAPSQTRLTATWIGRTS